MQKAAVLLTLVVAAQGLKLADKHLDEETPDLALNAKSDLVGTSEAKAKAFVINLFKRRDRCICMSNQLKSAPFKAERFQAIEFPDPRPKNLPPQFDLQQKNGQLPQVVAKPVSAADMQYSGYCNGIFERGVIGGKHSVLQEMSLYCSHFQLWTKLQREEEDAFVVMEDDLPMSSQIWEKIQGFIQRYKGQWDFVQVDAYAKNGTDMPIEDKVDEFEGAPIYKPSDNGDYWGGHMFILRKSALPRMLHRMKQTKAFPVDWIPKTWAKSSVAVRTIQFGLINYIDNEKRNEYYKESGCGTRVDMSDINFSGKRAKGNHQWEQRGSTAQNTGPLVCPVGKAPTPKPPPNNKK